MPSAVVGMRVIVTASATLPPITRTASRSTGDDERAMARKGRRREVVVGEVRRLVAPGADQVADPWGVALRAHRDRGVHRLGGERRARAAWLMYVAWASSYMNRSPAPAVRITYEMNAADQAYVPS